MLFLLGRLWPYKQTFKYELRLEEFDYDKYSSLFGLFVSDKVKTPENTDYK